ncbi:sigma-54-dependent Fis family transcriptional regulator [Flagellimonas aquimarina]|uniref:Sigma-54-dependent Fis family transcriptional regulator n=1 Tax=Flagellimonas aquimarina TaxID=2201895 RepID=A0A316L2W3_9FLAO|nr:sigma-54 dependent transcriptional regulator [Allomuricauda koreensis]PWL40176.1 sigma-54-dependent Fis family transcriptional regulator [Allomuricauda koreensis]
MPKILIIEDDTAFCQMLQKFLIKHDFDISTSFTIQEAKEKLKTSFFDVILSDVRLPEGDGVALLSAIKTDSPKTQVILMTGYAEVKTAVSAIKKGAFDYIAKPFTPENILAVIKNALNTKTQKTAELSESEKKRYTKNNRSNMIVGTGEGSRKLQQYIDLVAPTNMSVLITGESGTGKEVTAKAIHDKSKRKNENFVAVDCGAIPKEIAASEFFGHLRGSFTGAVEDKVGHFEAAKGGTLFLDEIGNLSYENQIQLLRALQERKIKRVGSTKEIIVDIRIITATNEDLLNAVREGTFREDLYHRLNEFSIEIPSLQERGEDLLIFANYFLDRANEELGKNVISFSDEVKHTLQNYSWPGNLRELKNVIKRAVLFSDGDVVMSSSIPKKMEKSSEMESESKFSKSNYEKEKILSALKQTNFNKSKAAKLLQITRKTLYNKINQYQLEV